MSEDFSALKGFEVGRDESDSIQGVCLSGGTTVMWLERSVRASYQQSLILYFRL